MEKILKKTKKTSGADEKTPSKAQYFSWINSTNEGSTDHQTMANLEYFEWMKERYGMQLDIYAWDAGNLDGAGGTYQLLDSKKLKKQYPDGYGPIAEKAAELGMRMGVWCGAGGYGDTDESAKKRYDTFITLCRDFGFGLFKVDTVCGVLDESKQLLFKQMIDECRRYVPDLILLNHRNDLGRASVCATTFLWQGDETYTDVFSSNPVTGPHHRVKPLIRGLTPDLLRLTEDHGTCISSCLDFFEDDLVVQAFSRSLILAPETYGNPWLLRDDEQATLANIYNLHRKYNKILVSGVELPESYGSFAVSRGDKSVRIICLRNPSWEPQRVGIKLDSEIGLDVCEKVTVMSKFPYETYIGTFGYGETAEVTVPPFRAALFLCEDDKKFRKEDFALTGCVYETIVPDKEVKIIKADGDISVIGCAASIDLPKLSAFDSTHRDPVLLGRGEAVPVPENAEALYEATAFRADNDAFEAQSLRRSGPTSVPAVQKARDEFFGQLTYKTRGCEGKNIFDGRIDTYFDHSSRYYGIRVDGGCLRVDLGEYIGCDSAELVYFSTGEPRYEIPEQLPVKDAGYSDDLSVWKTSPPEIKKLRDITAPFVVHSIHTIGENSGSLMKAVFPIDKGLRYFRLPSPVDRIYSFRLFSGGREIKPASPKANNMQALIDSSRFVKARIADITLPEEIRPGSYLAAALDGVHGVEGAYCAVSAEGGIIGAADRAPSYPVNMWEHICAPTDRNYTYYFPLSASDTGKKLSVTALYLNDDVPLTVWLCDGNLPREGVTAEISVKTVSAKSRTTAKKTI